MHSKQKNHYKIIQEKNLNKQIGKIVTFQKFIKIIIKYKKMKHKKQNKHVIIRI